LILRVFTFAIILQISFFFQNIHPNSKTFLLSPKNGYVVFSR
jgi:hypothetical protein